jgi:signal transduction histidine kinase
MVWIAAEHGRRYIGYASLGTLVALVMPVFFGREVASSADEWIRTLFSPVVFFVAAAVINELSRHTRRRLESVKRLAEERMVMLDESLERASALEDSEAKRRNVERMLRGVWKAVTEQSVIGTDVTGLIDAWNPGATKILGPLATDTEDKRHVDEFHLASELQERSRELNFPPGATVLNPGFSALVESARQGLAEVREWTYVRDDGSHVPVELSVTARLDEHGETIGYLFVASDVTKAREVARLKDEFVGLISHELRTPLSSILGYLELVRDDDEETLTAAQVRYLDVAERNAHRLLRLVGDLLFTAQVESGQFVLDTNQHDAGDVLKASVESARPVAAAAGVTLEVEIEEGVWLSGDTTRLAQAYDNLISNAVKFTPNGGRVTVSLAATDTNAVVTVADTGYGIPADEVDQLANRFFRSSSATANAVAGIGLGLTITKAIVQAHGGVLSVSSVEGSGTTFTVTVPLAEAVVSVS